MKCEYGFTPTKDCVNCLGTVVFFSIDMGTGNQQQEACIFCLEDAIRRGELDGTIGETKWVDGHVRDPWRTHDD